MGPPDAISPPKAGMKRVAAPTSAFEGDVTKTSTTATTAAAGITSKHHASSSSSAAHGCFSVVVITVAMTVLYSLTTVSSTAPSTSLSQTSPTIRTSPPVSSSSWSTASLSPPSSFDGTTTTRGRMTGDATATTTPRTDAAAAAAADGGGGGGATTSSLAPLPPPSGSETPTTAAATTSDAPPPPPAGGAGSAAAGESSSTTSTQSDPSLPPIEMTNVPRDEKSIPIVGKTDDFYFGIMPTWGSLPKNVFVETTPSIRTPVYANEKEYDEAVKKEQGEKKPSVALKFTQLPPFPTANPCFYHNGSIDGKIVAECLSTHVRRDRRTPQEMAQALLRRPRTQAKDWIKRVGGCTKKLLEEQTGHTAVLVFAAPPNFTVIDGDHLSWHYHEHIQRIVTSPSFMKRWERFKATGVIRKENDLAEGFSRVRPEEDSVNDDVLRNRSATVNQRWKDAEGFPMILQFGDFGNEERACVFEAYSQGHRRGTAFTVFDQYISHSRPFPFPSMEATRFSVYAKELFGPNVSSTKFLSKSETSSGGDERQEKILMELIDQFMAEANGKLPAWDNRTRNVYFRGSPTHRLRRFIENHVLGDQAPHLDIIVRKYVRNLGRGITTLSLFRKLDKFTAGFNHKALASLRGMSASLRDRSSLLGAAPIFRFLNIDKEPFQIYHDLMHPYVHYIPMPYRQHAQRIARFNLLHWRNQATRVAGEVLRHDDELKVVGQNNLRIGVMVASDDFRDGVMEEIIWNYIAMLDTVPDGPQAAPTTLDGAMKLCVHGRREPNLEGTPVPVTLAPVKNKDAR